ncbi:MAG TPA: hypothetical protein VF530_17830 [Planctomycetota bacterium]
MRVEFIPEGSPHCPLLCLRDFDPGQVRALRELLRELVAGARPSVRVEEHLELAGARMHFVSGDRDVGLEAAREGFRLVLTPLSWHNVEGLLEPFEAPHVDGYQWLDESGWIRLLISRDGSW